MLRLTLLPICLLGLLSCSSPSKALEKGRSKKAIRLAKSDLRKNKNITENITILNVAAHDEIDKVLASNTNKLSSPEVKDWIKVQNNYFGLLENIGEANQLSNGEVSEPYDRLCEHKTELDYKIADHYYQEGEEQLLAYHRSNEKSMARQAYGRYNLAQEYGADKYYADIQEKLDYCVEHGRVYYIAYDYSPSNDLFFRPLSESPHDVEADCVFSSSRSGYTTSETSSTSEKKYEERVQIGQESETDTSGIVTYTPIYEYVYAYKNTTDITVTLSTTTSVNVKNQTGQCHVRSWNFSKTVSDSYEEITFTGDSRAFPIGAKDETGVPAFFISKLQGRLDDAVEDELGI